MTHSHAEGLLRELLATIYDDGGHETERLGLVEATYAAIKIVSRLLAESDEDERACRLAEARLADESDEVVPFVAKVVRLRTERDEAHRSACNQRTVRERAEREVERLRAALSDVGVLVGLGRKWPDDLDSFAAAVDDVAHARLVAQRERDEARALAAEMWENADAWTGPTASSHYRSEISERLVRLKTGGDAALAVPFVAEVERLRTERDEARRNYQWMVEHACDQKLDGYRALGAAAAQAEKERDDARAEIQRLKAENERKAHVKAACVRLSDRIDELEQALQFTRHKLEVTQDALDLLHAEARLADESDEVVPFVSLHVQAAINAGCEAVRRGGVRRLQPEELGLSAEEAAEESDWLRLSHRLLDAIEAVGHTSPVPPALEGLVHWREGADASVRDLLRFVRQIGCSLQVEIREEE